MKNERTDNRLHDNLGVKQGGIHWIDLLRDNVLICDEPFLFALSEPRPELADGKFHKTIVWGIILLGYQLSLPAYIE